jgi:peptidoglycan/xylan/chitin deacetylase (PgdA/CDA1 family)/predicted ATP-grasp superfamily ATP-dependent carboligase
MDPVALLQTVAVGGPLARLTILIFHRVAERVDPLQDDIPTTEEFAAKMAVLARYFRPMPLREGLLRLKRGTLPPRAVAVTFDDGYADNCELALPVLLHHGVPATFFVATGFLNGGRMWSDSVIETVRRCPGDELDLEPIGLGRHFVRTEAERLATSQRLVAAVKYLPAEERAALVAELGPLAGVDLPTNLMMTTAQIRRMADAGMEIGAHTVTHPILAKIPLEEARMEIEESRDALQGLLGKTPTLFAYPNGKPGYDYTGEHAKLVLEAGFSAAVSTAWGSAGPSDDVFQIPRMTPWDRSSSRFAARLMLNIARPGASRTALHRPGDHPRAVILGTSLTALAVARNASDLGLDPLLVDDEEGIAAATSRAEVRLFRGSDDDRIIRELTARAKETPSCLIATSDKWLRFVARNREALDLDFARILHPRNEVLETCLDKRAFASFCERHGFPAPRVFDLHQPRTRPLPFPVLVRPNQSGLVPRSVVEKATHVDSWRALDELTRSYARAGVAAFATESLLGRNLEQWSVGLARRDGRIVGITAKKLRPAPAACSVGTFVALAWDEPAFALASSVVTALALEGFAEVEILRDVDSGGMFVIEVNPRPWVQFSLAPASGHDLLGFLLDPDSHNPRAAQRDSKVWVDLTHDAFAVLARSSVTDVDTLEWLRSLATANTYAVFSAGDLGPSRKGLRNLARLLTGAPEHHPGR